MADLNAYLFGSTGRQLLYKSLDAQTMRNRAIASNIANATTPGYDRQEVRFEDMVRSAMEQRLTGARTDQDHISIGKEQELSKVRPELYRPDDPTLPGEFNNVDIDMEAAKLAENQIQYNYSIKLASFDKFKAAIKGQGY